MKEIEMKKSKTIDHVVITALIVLLVSSAVCSEEIQYKTKTDSICGDARIEIVTKYHKFTHDSPPYCDAQKLTFKNNKTGKTIVISPSGIPQDDDLDVCAQYYQCFRGKKTSYLIFTYYTGGNCEECIWQGILDLQGNRIAVDITKKQKTSFARKLKELGLPNSAELENIDFEVISKDPEELK